MSHYNRHKKSSSSKGKEKYSKKSVKHKKNKVSSARNKNPMVTKFLPCNSTNIQIIRDYFETITPTLYNKLANSGKYQLFQYEGNSNEIFLVPIEISQLVKKFTKKIPIFHAGIHLGYMRRKRTHTGFERAFYLSYEGGEFIYSIIQSSLKKLKSEIQTITLDVKGEKSFLYGQNIDFESVISDTSKLSKKRVIFVLNNQKRYIGLSLLLVKQAGAVNSEAKDSKFQAEYSRSPNFTLALINLIDAGYFLRKGN